VVFERYSDSAAAFVRLDSDNSSVYKQLYRAAKAKLKLRIKATVTRSPLEAQPAVTEAPKVEPTTGELPPYMYYSTFGSQPFSSVGPQVVAPAASTTTLVNTQQDKATNQGNKKPHIVTRRNN
jgi:next-to-BRCA1 protein 1